MKLHPTTIRTNIPSAEMGEQLARLRYDKLLLVIGGMVDELQRQGFHDLELGRPKLAALLHEAREKLIEAEFVLEKVVALCSPFIAAERAIEKGFPTLKQIQYKDVVQRFTSYTFRL
jgi:hypothetical protein